MSMIHGSDWLGRGRYGEVRLVEHGGERMAQKTYRERPDRAKIFRTLLDSWQRVKTAGCATLGRFIVDNQNFTTYATDLTENGKYIVSGYGNVHKNEQENASFEITNLPELLTSAFNSAVKAARTGVEVAGDAYLFRRETEKKMVLLKCL